VVTNATGHRIHGCGDVTGKVVNHGTISGDWGSQALNLTHPELHNLGVVEARNGGTLVVADPAGNFSAGTLAGGTWRVTAGSVLRLLGAAVERNAAAIVLDGANSFLVRDAGLTDALAGFRANLADGFFTLRNGRSFTLADRFDNAGEVTIGKGSVFQSGIAGTGYAQAATGKLRFEIGGRAAGEHGRLTVTGTASVAGILAADFVDGFVPALGDTFQVATYGAITGSFQGFDCPVVNGLRLVPTVHAKRIVLTALPPGVDVVEPAVALPQRLELLARFTPGGGGELELALPEPGEVQVALFDLRGRRVVELWRGARPAGRLRRALDAAQLGLARGVYFARAEVRTAAAREARTTRVVLLR